jgi:hypothetical protein
MGFVGRSYWVCGTRHLSSGAAEAAAPRPFVGTGRRGGRSLPPLDQVATPDTLHRLTGWGWFCGSTPPRMPPGEGGFDFDFFSRTGAKNGSISGCFWGRFWAVFLS